ncbi:MAG: RNase adapter RapZ [Mogibacterium sp.]|nr:RNase adapter RapZ [Mogibacterium sp.]
MKVTIITGMSGAGKTKAADWFEDQGYYCIDNMPPQLVRNVLELSALGGSPIEKAAFVTDVRGGTFFEELEKCVDELRVTDGVESTVLFLEASVSTIVKRYNETRRNHPLGGGQATEEIIEEEKALLAGMRKKADFIVDTTGMKVAEFNAELNRLINDGDNRSSFTLNLTSFGYKYGIPTEADIQIDVRFIPNPFYVKSLKKLTGNNRKVRDYVMRYEITQEFITGFHAVICSLIPGYIQEGKYHLNIAFGCTGGHHRSVAMANEFGKLFREDGYRVTVTHRDLDFVRRK